MKEINRAFGMKMLERIIGRPAKEIEHEATYESEMWPMGDAEFEASLNGKIRVAKIIVDYYHGERPNTITMEDVGNIRNRVVTQASSLTRRDFEFFRDKINLVFDIYEEDL